MGSVDIMMELQKDTLEYDAVWPANSLWISLGDKRHRIKHAASIMKSPVVFGIRKSLAEQLGYVNAKVSIKEIHDDIINKRLSFMMTSATQSNSGASAYMGFLYSLLGNPEIITKEDLYKPELQDDITKLLSGVHRSSGSSGWLKELFLKGNYDAMVNYEAVIIEANQELVRSDREPLYVVYPYDGLVMADSPLGYVNRGDEKKEEIFLKLQDYLMSEKVQGELLKTGRRTGFGGTIENVDTRVFNPEWGIDTTKVLSPIRMPSADVIHEALNLYQTQFKKPSITVYCLDFSGSMMGEGERRLKEAMNLILDKEVSKQYFLQPSSNDIVVVLPFSDRILDEWRVDGADTGKLNELMTKINSLKPKGGTDIYSPSIYALELMLKEDIKKYMPAVVLMTDGESNTGMKFNDIRNTWDNTDIDIPVFSIMFGKASKRQLDEIAELTRGRVFDGKHDLISAFKKVRGYN
jgi:Ca-activated chloride channel homolog